MTKRIISVVGVVACAVSSCAMAQPVTTSAPRVERRPELAIDALQPAQDAGLRDLLRAGYDIIHIDAPAGQNASRFILRKDDKIYSCAPLVYREGGSNGDIRIIDSPCIDLTP